MALLEYYLHKTTTNFVFVSKRPMLSVEAKKNKFKDARKIKDQ